MRDGRKIASARTMRRISFFSNLLSETKKQGKARQTVDEVQEEEKEDVIRVRVPNGTRFLDTRYLNNTRTEWASAS
jgi:hypothetical protein